MISIVLIAHNQEGFVREAISSALGQLYPDVEVIAVDAGSTDRTWKRLVAAAMRNDRLRVAWQPNRGPAYARNAGAKLAYGDALLFLDGDDALDPHYLAKTAPILDARPEVSVVFTDTQEFGDGSAVVRNGPWEALPQKNPVPVCALIRRSAFEEVGGYREDEGMYADWGLWVELHHRGHGAVHVPEPLWLYRRHPAAWTSRASQTERDGLRALVMAKHAEAFA